MGWLSPAKYPAGVFRWEPWVHWCLGIHPLSSPKSIPPSLLNCCASNLRRVVALLFDTVPLYFFLYFLDTLALYFGVCDTSYTLSGRPRIVGSALCSVVHCCYGPCILREIFVTRFRVSIIHFILPFGVVRGFVVLTIECIKEAHAIYLLLH